MLFMWVRNNLSLDKNSNLVQYIFNKHNVILFKPTKYKLKI